MIPKTARAYTVDELKEKCQKALADPKLIEIVRTAPLNKNGKVNLSWVYKEAEKYVHGETGDLQKTKELAVETRFLGMLRRDFAEEFEKLAFPSESKKEEVWGLEKTQREFRDIEFYLPQYTEVITRKVVGGFGHDNTTLKFDDIRVRNFCLEILTELMETRTSRYFAEHEKPQLVNDLIQFLEEKSRCKVRFCVNCNNSAKNDLNYVPAPCEYEYYCWYHKRGLHDLSHSCKDWSPKISFAD